MASMSAFLIEKLCESLMMIDNGLMRLNQDAEVLQGNLAGPSKWDTHFAINSCNHVSVGKFKCHFLYARKWLCFPASDYQRNLPLLRATNC